MPIHKLEFNQTVGSWLFSGLSLKTIVVAIIGTYDSGASTGTPNDPATFPNDPNASFCSAVRLTM